LNRECGPEKSGGIEVNAEFQPETGKAGHSFAGLEAFRHHLQEMLKVNGVAVELGKRVLAVSFSAPSEAPFPIPRDKENRAVVWFREMLEPTISTFNLRDCRTS